MGQLVVHCFFGRLWVVPPAMLRDLLNKKKRNVKTFQQVVQWFAHVQLTWFLLAKVLMFFAAIFVFFVVVATCINMLTHLCRFYEWGRTRERQGKLTAHWDKPITERNECRVLNKQRPESVNNFGCLSRCPFVSLSVAMSATHSFSPFLYVFALSIWANIFDKLISRHVRWGAANFLWQSKLHRPRKQYVNKQQEQQQQQEELQMLTPNMNFRAFSRFWSTTKVKFVFIWRRY